MKKILLPNITFERDEEYTSLSLVAEGFTDVEPFGEDPYKPNAVSVGQISFNTSNLYNTII